jgi:hypothetical protein
VAVVNPNQHLASAIDILNLKMLVLLLTILEHNPNGLLTDGVWA